MTISFFEPGDVPQPPEKTKIELLEANPHQDSWRIKVIVHVTPFQQRPNLEIDLLKAPELRQVASLSIVETMHPRMEFTMHIRGVDNPSGEYKLRAVLFYRDEAAPEATEPPPPQIKDTRELTLSIPMEEK